MKDWDIIGEYYCKRGGRALGKQLRSESLMRYVTKRFTEILKLSEKVKYGGGFTYSEAVEA